MARKVISLMGDATYNEEKNALEAVTPGHLLETTSLGVKKNTANAANVAPQFAMERSELGKGIDVAYAIGDTVLVGVFGVGKRVYAFLASGQNVLESAYLTGDAAGCLTATGVTAGLRLARALEAVNATTGQARIRVVIV